MNKLILKFVSLSFMFFSCSSNVVKNKLREGLWVEKDSIGNDLYTIKGRYKNGNPIRKWKYKRNSIVYKREVYKDSACFITFFDNDGKIFQKGNSKFRYENQLLHWFYQGKWFVFDKKKKIIAIKTYLNGKLILEEKL